MSGKVRQEPIRVGLISITGLMWLWLFVTNTATGQTAEAFYASDVESIVQGKCIRCHRSGGQASYTALIFTSSVSGNHNVFDRFVNSPTKGARANTVLSKIRGAAGHGGGVVLSQGSADYQTMSSYIDLLSDDQPASYTVTPSIGRNGSVSPSTPQTLADGTSVDFTFTADSGYELESLGGCDAGAVYSGTKFERTVTVTVSASTGDCTLSATFKELVDPSVLKVALEEPVRGQVHTGVGNLRGWAIASEGITKVEILVDGVLAFEAPYGGERGDVGGAFPDVAGSSESGFALAYNYSSLSAGPHTITAIAHNALGETKKSAARFEVVRFDSPFISDPNAVNLDNASCTVSSDEISIIDALVEGSLYDLRLEWRTAEQGFEIIEIR